jgi:nitrite reductase/ring-hydroxylating ferredoxin subunit
MVPTEPVTLGAPDDIPVGGAKLYRQERLVVSQPAEGQYKAFGSVCTHGRCELTEIEGTDLRCVCHGSRFDAVTGKALQGPAVAPLPAVPVTMEDGKLVAGEAQA